MRPVRTMTLTLARREIRQALESLKAKLAAAKQKDKSLYGGMFK